MERVDFSLYALEETVHDYITRRKGSLARTLKGIQRLHDRGIPVLVNCVVMNANKSHYQQLVEELTDRGIRVALDGAIMGTNTGSLETYPLNLCTSDKVDVAQFSQKHDMRPPKLTNKDPDDLICAAGRISAYIQPDGQLTPCVSWPMQLGNLKELSLVDLWKSSPKLQEIRASRRKDRTGCASCTFEKQCSYCPGHAHMENGGDWLAPYSLQCEETAAHVYGTLAYNAEQIRKERPRKAHFNVLKPGALHPGPGQSKTTSKKAAFRIPAHLVEQAGRKQKGKPRSHQFNVLTDAQVLAAQQEAKPVSLSCP